MSKETNVWQLLTAKVWKDLSNFCQRTTASVKSFYFAHLFLFLFVFAFDREKVEWMLWMKVSYQMGMRANGRNVMKWNVQTTRSFSHPFEFPLILNAFWIVVKNQYFYCGKPYKLAESKIVCQFHSIFLVFSWKACLSSFYQNFMRSKLVSLLLLFSQCGNAFGNEYENTEGNLITNI